MRKGTGGREDGSTHDRLLPFKKADDFATPNEEYFARCDRMIRIAEKHGLKTPLTRRIVTLIHDIEDGKLPLDRSNLDRLAEAMPKK